MRHLVSSILCVMLGFICLSGVADERVVSLSYVSYPPYYDENLPQGGPLSELIEAAFALEGFVVKRELLPWSRAIKWTEEGKYDAIYTAWYRKEREQNFAFSSPLPGNELVLFRAKSSGITYKAYEDLASYTIGVVRDYVNPPGFDEAGLKLFAVTSDKQNILKLANNRIDLALSDKAVGKYIIRTELTADKAAMIDWLEPPLKVEPQYVMFSKKAANFEEKRLAFNKGLQKLTESGELQKIIRKHGL